MNPVALVLACTTAAGGLGTEEFGLSGRELAKKAEQVEQHVAACMREQGFEYVAVDYITIRKGMSADKRLPGMDEEEFISRHGYGVSTLYTGRAPQLEAGYSPARTGLGERNVAVFRALPPASRAAYNRALFGENTDASFAVGLEVENFSRSGGCTRNGIEASFESHQLEATYYNPKDSLINRDRRMRVALRRYAAEMRRAGFDYDHPDEVETDVRERLNAILGGRTIPLEALSPTQREALAKLQDFERRVAVKDFQLAQEIFDPVEELIERELFAREVK